MFDMAPARLRLTIPCDWLPRPGSHLWGATLKVETIPESGLDAMLLQALYPQTDADDTQVEIDVADLADLADLADPAGLADGESEDYYAAVELVPDETTGTFVRPRDTSHDHIPTVRFPLALLDAETRRAPRVALPRPARRVANGTPVPPLSTVAERASVFAASHALPFPVESLPFERVEIELFDAPKRPRQETEIIERGPQIVVVIAVLVSALALGVSVVLLLAR